MFSRTGTRSDSGIGRLWLNTFSPAQAGLAARAVEVDAERLLRRQRLDDADVGDRRRRRIDLAIVDREGVAVAADSVCALPGSWAAASASFKPSIQLRTISSTARSSVARSGFGASPSERPMMKCTRTSGPSGKNG